MTDSKQKPEPYVGKISPAALRVLAIQAEWKAAARESARRLAAERRVAACE